MTRITQAQYHSRIVQESTHALRENPSRRETAARWLLKPEASPALTSDSVQVVGPVKGIAFDGAESGVSDEAAQDRFA
jgi:hypothetical protein